MNDIDTLPQLVEQVSNEKTGGYDVDFDIQPRKNAYRAGNGFWLVIEVASNNPESTLPGQWWFDADNNVMQVL